jgi:hypothetical protein
MKKPHRNNFDGFLRVSGFPYMWLRTLFYIGVVIAAAIGTYLAVPAEDTEMRIVLCVVASFLLSMLTPSFNLNPAINVGPR